LQGARRRAYRAMRAVRWGSLWAYVKPFDTGNACRNGWISVAFLLKYLYFPEGSNKQTLNNHFFQKFVTKNNFFVTFERKSVTELRS
jgi:hypothetical protein